MSKKILVVDDEAHINRLVKFILEKQGYKVTQAFDGEECLEKVKIDKPDLVVLDVMMPGMDGFEVADELVADPETKNIRILMLSSKAQFEDKMRGIDSGAMYYITKPFDNKDFVKKVKECLE